MSLETWMHMSWATRTEESLMSRETSSRENPAGFAQLRFLTVSQASDLVRAFGTSSEGTWLIVRRRLPVSQSACTAQPSGRCFHRLSRPRWRMDKSGDAGRDPSDDPSKENQQNIGLGPVVRLSRHGSPDDGPGDGTTHAVCHIGPKFQLHVPPVLLAALMRLIRWRRSVLVLSAPVADSRRLIPHGSSAD